jgi:hypothetical protein
VLLALSLSTELLALFVVLPFVVGGIVMAVISARSPNVPVTHTTSGLLANGEPGRAEVLDLRRLGNFFDVRPMVAFRLQVRPGAAGEDGEPFELVVTQSVPRRVAATLQPGMVLDVRLSADHLAGAVVIPSDER